MSVSSRIACEPCFNVLISGRIYDERIAKDSEYPAIRPSVGDSPQYPDVARRFIHPRRQDSPMRFSQADYYDGGDREDDLRTTFAPPG